MKIADLSQKFLYDNYHSKKVISRTSFKSSNGVIYEDDYVKVPKKNIKEIK